jgi:hypothetical protein
MFLPDAPSYTLVISQSVHCVVFPARNRARVIIFQARFQNLKARLSKVAFLPPPAASITVKFLRPGALGTGRRHSCWVAGGVFRVAFFAMSDLCGRLMYLCYHHRSYLAVWLGQSSFQIGASTSPLCQHFSRCESKQHPARRMKSSSMSQNQSKPIRSNLSC